MPNGTPPARDRASGLMIAICAALIVFAMMHHPHSISDHGSNAPDDQLLRVNGIVHVGMIVLVLVMTAGWIGFAMRLGMESSLVRLGLIGSITGAIANVGAGAINGIVMPAVKVWFAESTYAENDAVHAVGVFAWEANQALAGIGLVAVCASAVFWSAVLVRTTGAWRWVGALGLLGGSLGCVGYFTGSIDTDVEGFSRFVFGYAAWSMLVGVRLAR